MILPVAKAEQQLRDAKAQEAIDQRQASRAQLATIREELLATEQRLEELSATLKRRDVAIATAQSAIDIFTARLTEHVQIRPDIVDLLPDDPEVKEWVRHQASLQKAHAQAVARRRELENSGPSKLDAVRLYEQLTQLQRAERNLIEQLRGTGPAGGWKSSLSRVL